jgi:hypothetical protein
VYSMAKIRNTSLQEILKFYSLSVTIDFQKSKFIYSFKIIYFFLTSKLLSKFKTSFGLLTNSER